MTGDSDLEDWCHRLLGARNALRQCGLVLPSKGSGYTTTDERTDSKDCTVNGQRISHGGPDT